MKLVTPRQMNEIDSIAINRIGIPGMVLMENAALKVVEEIAGTLGSMSGRKIVLFAGRGNNGGDAFAAARHLYNKGADVRVYLTAAREGMTNDAKTNLAILERIGMEITVLSEEAMLPGLIEGMRDADLLVDGIFGTGLKGRITGLTAKVIETINDSQKPVISIDIPSGVNGETGEVEGACIKACRTVTFGLPKTGLVVHPGCDFTGELVVADIGIPSCVVDSLETRTHILDRELVSGFMPQRRRDTNKGDYGRVLIISGSVGMTGAGCLAAGAALRTGAGLVYLCVPSLLASVFDTILTESITVPLEDEGRGYLSKRCIEQLKGRLENAAAVAIGPGLTVNDDIVEIVDFVIDNSAVPLVLDADALNAVSRDVRVLKKLKTSAVVTPHPGEMARLTGMGIDEVQKDRMGTAREFACKWGVVTVLKGSRTVVAGPDGSIFINPTGNPGMATGGTGDVLTGVTAALLGQGVRPLAAAAAAVYLHGLAGDMAADEMGQYGLTAGDMVARLPHAIKSIVG